MAEALLPMAYYTDAFHMKLEEGDWQLPAPRAPTLDIPMQVALQEAVGGSVKSEKSFGKQPDQIY